MASSPLTVVARQRFDVSPARVFRAFTDPALLIRWFSPSPAVSIEVLHHDLRPAGRYRYRYREADGTVSIVTGAFVAIEPPARLVFTWSWEPPDPHAGVETLVSVQCIALGAGTDVTVTHERFPDDVSRSRHELGWRGTLARLPASGC